MNEMNTVKMLIENEEYTKRLSVVNSFKNGLKTFDSKRIFIDLKFNVKMKPVSKRPFNITVRKVNPLEKIEVVSLRDMLYYGYSATSVASVDGFDIYYLRNGNDVMFATHPREMFQMSFGIDAAHGNVLVGGLGLGYVASKIAEKKNVSSVTVVEIEKKIIDMVAYQINSSKITVVHGDIFDFIKSTDKRFDYCYFDTYYGTGEAEFCDSVIPLSTAACKKFGDKIDIKCWCEEEMIPQIKDALLRAFYIPEKYCRWKPMYVFKKGCSDNVDESIEAFLSNVGSSDWCKRWKWDDRMKEM